MSVLFGSSAGASVNKPPNCSNWP